MINELLDNSPITHENIQNLNTSKISFKQISCGVAKKIQPRISKAIWRPAPGRKLAFTLNYDDRIIGFFFLASPVINMNVRDFHLGLSSNPSEKGKQLRNYMDLSGCVGLQPVSWYWNIGKLIAMAATSKEISDIYFSRYGDELKGITTTSLWGKGSMYNRIYKFLGYTKGYGHYHITDEKYQEMLKWMKQNNVEIPSCRFGAGSNPRMRRISAYIKASGEKLNLKHGSKRGVYYSNASKNTFDEIVNEWHERWGKPRNDRVKNEIAPYQNGLE